MFHNAKSISDKGSKNLFGTGDDAPISLQDVITAVNSALEAGE